MRLFSTTEVKIFFLGFFSGVLILAIILMGVGYSVAQQGVTVTIPYEQVAAPLTAVIAEQVEKLLPQYLVQVRGQIPELVAGQVKSGLGSASLQIGNYEVKLPTAVVRGLDSHLQLAVSTALVKVVDGLDTREITRLTIGEIESQVMMLFRSQPNGVIVRYKLFGRFVFPIKIKLQ